MLSCSFCRRAIVGAYVHWDDGTHCCQSCKQRLPSCDLCGLPHEDGIEVRGQRVCAACAARSETCVLCSLPITGKYFEHPNAKPVCEPCFERYPHCARCGVPTKRGTPTDERGENVLCSSCWAVADRCHSCSIPFVGGERFLVFEHSPEEKFCEQCRDNADACDFCQRPFGAGGFTYPDGRHSCGACRKTAVVRPAQLAELETLARSWLRERLHFKLRPGSACPTKLASAAEIAAVQGRTFVSSEGFDRRERGLFSANVVTTTLGSMVVSRNEHLVIYVEVGLPRDDAMGTTTHELTHLWQFDHYREDAPALLIEGLACWTQFHMLRESGAEAAARSVERNRDPLYGGGFRRVRQIEQRVGFDATIAAVLREVGK